MYNNRDTFADLNVSRAFANLSFRFIQNCVPTPNGILLSSSISITYFILSLFSLALMYGFFETVSYGLKSVLYWTRVGVLVYGIVISVLGLLIFIVELP